MAIADDRFVSRPSSVNPDDTSFGFVIHARDLKDLTNNYPETADLSDEEVRAYADEHSPGLLGEIINDNGRNGVYVASIFDPSKLMRKPKFCRGKVVESAEYAGSIGLRYAGLGGLSASLTRYGELLENIDVEFTTGHALTPWTLDQMVKRSVEYLGIDSPSVSVVGAAGSVGTLLTARLARRGYSLQLIDLMSKEEDLDRLRSLGENINYSFDVEDSDSCDIVVSATSNDRRLIDINKVKPGTVLIDDAQPWCWDHFEGYERFQRDGDLLPLEGGFLTTSDASVRQDWLDTKNPRREDFFCCLGEVLLLAHSTNGLRPIVGKNSFGNMEERLEMSDKYGAAAEAMGISNAPMQSGSDVLDPEKLEEFKRFRQSLS